jgi:type I restriction enzyme, R subunit
MNHVGQIERITQNRVAALFRDQLHYTHLGDWKTRKDNSNVETALLTTWLTKQALMTR